MKFIICLMFLVSIQAKAEVLVEFVGKNIVVTIDNERAYLPYDEELVKSGNAEEIVRRACKMLRCKEMKYVSK